MIQAVGTRVDLTERFEVVYVVHDETEVRRSDFVDQFATGSRVFEYRDEMGLDDGCDAVALEAGYDAAQGVDQQIPGFGGVVVTMRRPAAPWIETAGTDQEVVCRQGGGDPGRVDDFAADGPANPGVRVEEALGISDRASKTSPSDRGSSSTSTKPFRVAASWTSSTASATSTACFRRGTVLSSI